MKKIIGIASMALVLAVVFMTSCKKDTSAPVDQKQYVKAIAGSFVVKNGDVTLKSTPVGVSVDWSMYAKNSPFYAPAVLALVDGREFITGSAAYNFWSNPANNPVNFPVGTSLYSNLTPNEDLRIISETKDVSNNVAYLGMLDFNPETANFPLTIHGFRLGDELTINTDAITSLPGGNNLTITVAYSLAPIDLTATKAKVTLSGTSPGVPNGTEFGWGDIIYGALVPTTSTIGAGNFAVYDYLDKKAFGNIVISISETGNGGSLIQKTVSAAGLGKGLFLKLTTTKIGWYDSGTISFTDTDITVETVLVPVN